MRRVHPEGSGFTLIELLIALVISGVLAGAIFEFLREQGRFARLQTAREEVQQNARVVLETLAGELRGVGEAGLVAASSTSLAVRVPRAWGVVCGFLNGGTTDLAVLFGEPPPPFRSTTDSLAVRSGGVWSVGEVTDQTAANATATVDLCNAALIPLPLLSASAEADVARVRLFRGSAPLPGTPAGEIAYVFELARYDLVTYPASADPSGTWIRRYVGGSPQPFAGPLLPDPPSDEGLRFQYFSGAGTDLTTEVVGSAAARDAVARVQVMVRTRSTGRVANIPQENADSTSVFLRNRF